jgi:hypothetical protein
VISGSNPSAVSHCGSSTLWRRAQRAPLETYLDPLGRQVVFDATRTHERDGPERFLAAFPGHLQADAYRGYYALCQRRARPRDRLLGARARPGAQRRSISNAYRLTDMPTGWQAHCPSTERMIRPVP